MDSSAAGLARGLHHAQQPASDASYSARRWATTPHPPLCHPTHNNAAALPLLISAVSGTPDFPHAITSLEGMLAVCTQLLGLPRVHQPYADTLCAGLCSWRLRMHACMRMAWQGPVKERGGRSPAHTLS